MAVHPPRIQNIGQAHRVIDRIKPDAPVMRTHQNVAVIFQIVPDFQHRLILEQWFQHGDGIIESDLLGDRRLRIKSKPSLPVRRHRTSPVAKRHIAGPPGCQRHGDADKLGRRRVQRACLGIDGKITLTPGGGGPVP